MKYSDPAENLKMNNYSCHSALQGGSANVTVQTGALVPGFGSCGSVVPGDFYFEKGVKTKSRAVGRPHASVH